MPELRAPRAAMRRSREASWRDYCRTGKPMIWHSTNAEVFEEFKRLCALFGLHRGTEATRAVRARVTELREREQSELRAKREQEAREAELWGLDARKAAVDSPAAGEPKASAEARAMAEADGEPDPYSKPAFWAKPKAR